MIPYNQSCIKCHQVFSYPHRVPFCAECANGVPSTTREVVEAILNPTPSPSEREIDPELPSKYHRCINGAVIDAYDIGRAYGITDPSIFHALKKILRNGCGDKSQLLDMREARWSLDNGIKFLESSEGEVGK